MHWMHCNSAWLWGKAPARREKARHIATLNGFHRQPKYEYLTLINTCHEIISLEIETHQWAIYRFSGPPQSPFCRILIKSNEARKMCTKNASQLTIRLWVSQRTVECLIALGNAIRWVSKLDVERHEEQIHYIKRHIAQHIQIDWSCNSKLTNCSELRWKFNKMNTRILMSQSKPAGELHVAPDIDSLTGSNEI